MNIIRIFQHQDSTVNAYTIRMYTLHIALYGNVYLGARAAFPDQANLSYRHIKVACAVLVYMMAAFEFYKQNGIVCKLCSNK